MAHGGTNVTATAVDHLQQLLNKIKVKSLTANPNHLQPFQSTTIAYQVTLPTGLTVPVEFNIGDQKFHGTSGSGSFTVTGTTTFLLTAVAELVIAGVPQQVTADLKSVTVTVNQSACRSGSIAGLLITAGLASTLNTDFAGRIRDGSTTTATLSTGGISIQIPLKLDSQGTMDIDVELFVQQDGQSISVLDNSVTVRIHLNTDLNVGSWCSNAMAEIVQPFMQHIVDNEMAPGLQQQLLGPVNDLIKSAHNSDHLHRGFALTSFVLTPDGATFMVCPTSPGIVITGVTTSTQ